MGKEYAELDTIALHCTYSEFETYLEYAEDCLGFCESEYAMTFNTYTLLEYWATYLISELHQLARRAECATTSL